MHRLVRDIVKTLNLTQLASILLAVLALSVGQVLFKQAANQIHDFRDALRSLGSGWLLVALLVYAVATVLWVDALRSVPLSVAYPFAAMAFFIVPVLSHLFLDERFTARSAIGACVIFVGIWISNA